MKHNFTPSLSNREVCVTCGYDKLAHGPNAICEACGEVATCDFFPDTKHPKKILLCEPCVRKEIQEAVRAQREREKKLREHEEIKSTGDYFNANIPGVMEIEKMIGEDASIPVEKKDVEITRAIKNRLIWLQDTISARRKEVSELEHEHRETRINLNYRMKKLSAEIQAELGLNDIVYPTTKAKKATTPKTAPTVKKFDKNKLREVCAKYNLLDAEPMIQGIVTARKLDYEEAAKLYMQMVGAK